MKKIAILIAVITLMSFTYLSNEETYSLTINVEGFRNSKGDVIFALYNKEGSIPDERYETYFKKQVSKIINNKSTVTFLNLQKGTYAVSILHDENKNGKIDKGILLPKEGIGFSNYESIGLSNRPKFSKASFELNNTIIKVIKIVYL